MNKNNVNGYGNDSHCVVLINGEEDAIISDTFNEVSRGGTKHKCTLSSYLGFVPSRSNIIKKFDSNSWYFPSTGYSNMILIDKSAHSDWDIGTGDFTLDYWEYNDNYFITSGTQEVFITGCYQDISDYWGIIYNIVGGTPGIMTIHFKIQAPAGTVLDISFTPGANASIWTHYAIVKNADTFNFYMNGELKASGTLLTLPTINTNLEVGVRSAGGAYDRSIYIDGYRFSKGIARWNNNFTIPNRAY